MHAILETPLILVINPKRPFKTMPEPKPYAKTNSGKLTFGSAALCTGPT